MRGSLRGDGPGLMKMITEALRLTVNVRRLSEEGPLEGTPKLFYGNMDYYNLMLLVVLCVRLQSSIEKCSALCRAT